MECAVRASGRDDEKATKCVVINMEGAALGWHGVRIIILLYTVTL